MHKSQMLKLSNNDIIEAVYLDSKGKSVNNNGLAEPCAYTIQYKTETGQPLFAKTIKLSYDDIPETIREAYCYDSKNQALKIIRYEEELVRVFDVLNNQMYNYYSFEDEYDDYIHIIDSIQNDIEMKYGKPKLYKYVK